MLVFVVLKFVASTTVCNGPDYEPLGCFTDDYPFSIPIYRPGC